MKYSAITILALAAAGLAMPGNDNHGRGGNHETRCSRQEYCCDKGLHILNIHRGGVAGGNQHCRGSVFCCDKGGKVGRVLDRKHFNCNKM
ncbi:hypothetical protein RJ55_03573 [Drechmeria coniospora]|nr:hypothetical protein RJ55_03573 [Drechmeria coniospora]